MPTASRPTARSRSSRVSSASRPSCSLALREDGVLRVPSRLEAGLEDRPAQGYLARQDQPAARRRSEPAPAAGAREQRRPTERARLGDSVEPTRFALLVGLTDEPEPLLHRAHKRVLD